MKSKKYFDWKTLIAPPKYEPTELAPSPVPGVQAILYDSVPYRGKPTKVFAYLGVPENAEPGRCPAVVLIHGGLGTAFAQWVKTWTDRGYVAISMDTCGGVPDETKKEDGNSNWPRHPFSGPEGWGGVGAMDDPVRDHWMLHAVSAVILANSLVRSLPQVNPNDVGMTGVSWGGILCCVVGGLDPRFRWGVPVYGCGFLDETGGSLDNNPAPAAMKKKWKRRWDPSNYLGHAAMPFLFLTGTNDFAFPIPALMKSIDEHKGPTALSLRVNMLHGHGEVSEKPGEIPDFAECVRSGRGMPLTASKPRRHKGGKIGCRFQANRKIVRAELNFTRGKGYSSDRFWNTVPAELSEGAEGRVYAPFDCRSRAAFFNFYDEAGRVYSSPVREFRSL